MKSYNYILLDWDGNLAQTLHIWLAALKAALEKRGHAFSDEQIGANFTLFKERMESIGVDDVDAMVAEADSIATHNAPYVELYPDAITTLETLRNNGKKLALVTTSRHDQIDPLLEKYGMVELFEVVVCGDDVTNHKPHPEPLERALQLLDAKKDEAVMVGDSASDITGAKNAGVDSILFFPKEHATFYDFEKLKQLQPTFIVEDFSDIIRIAGAK